MNTLRKTQKKLSVTLNKARIKRLRGVEARGDLPEPKLLRLIREPNKKPIVVESARLLEDFYPKLVQ